MCLLAGHIYTPHPTPEAHTFHTYSEVLPSFLRLWHVAWVLVLHPSFARSPPSFKICANCLAHLPGNSGWQLCWPPRPLHYHNLQLEVGSWCSSYSSGSTASFAGFLWGWMLPTAPGMWYTVRKQWGTTPTTVLFIASLNLPTHPTMSNHMSCFPHEWLEVQQTQVILVNLHL